MDKVCGNGLINQRLKLTKYTIIYFMHQDSKTTGYTPLHHAIEDPETQHKGWLKVPTSYAGGPRISQASVLSIEEHDERVSFLYYIFALLLIGLADLLYNQPLYDLTLRVVPPWQAQYQDDDLEKAMRVPQSSVLPSPFPHETKPFTSCSATPLVVPLTRTSKLYTGTLVLTWSTRLCMLSSARKALGTPLGIRR
ncbi:hypothetical protein FGO68_gene9613 [Halteria grandinella]|uniref:Uncharacterized protein n=1 Tax=Halteria grandinella TaxID=5974 RepID=A0A8J8SWA0_HALGN|nr:hypothetical protein FGO68_gene9613 [Halteria grandinella]